MLTQLPCRTHFNNVSCVSPRFNGALSWESVCRNRPIIGIKWIRAAAVVSCEGVLLAHSAARIRRYNVDRMTTHFSDWMSHYATVIATDTCPDGATSGAIDSIEVHFPPIFDVATCSRSCKRHSLRARFVNTRGARRYFHVADCGVKCGEPYTLRADRTLSSCICKRHNKLVLCGR